MTDYQQDAVPHVSRLEAGTHLPSVATLKKVADALEVPICSLIDPPPDREKPARHKKGDPPLTPKRKPR